MSPAALKVAELLWQRRLCLGLAAAALTLLAACWLPSLAVSNSLEVWYPDDGPAMRRFRDWQARFGGDEIVVVAISRDGGFADDAGIELVAGLTDRLFEIEGVADVTSLATVPASMRGAAARLNGHDGRTTALLARLIPGGRFEPQRHRVLGDIRSAVAEFEVVARYAGYGVIYDALNDASTRGSATLIVAAHVTMVLLLLLLFRRPLPVLLTLVAVGMATTWTMGVYVWSGRALNMVTMALPTLIWVIGTASCVHLLRSIERAGDRLPHERRVVLGIAAVIRPCCVACVTTAAGFLALSASGLPVVSDLGMFGAIGVTASLLASSIVVAAGASWPAAVPARRNRWIGRLARALYRIGDRRPRTTVAVFVLLALPSAAGISRLSVDTDSIAYLPEDHPVRRDSDFVENTIGPYMPLEFVVRSEDVLAPELLEALDTWQVASADIPAIGWSWSLRDVIGRNSGGPIDDALERLRRFSPALAATLISDRHQLRVTFGTRVLSAAATRRQVEALLAAAHFPDGVSVEATGYTPLYTRIVERIVQSQLNGFGVGLALILVCLAVALRSLPRLLMALPANLLPVAVTVGLMGLVGIPLDVATATIATVVLGLVVDDSVHILRPGRQVRGAMSDAVRQSGSTLIATSIVLSAGFLVLGLAGIRSVAWFGLLTAFALWVALFADLMLLPALARLFVTDSSEKHRLPIRPQGADPRKLRRVAT